MTGKENVSALFLIMVPRLLDNINRPIPFQSSAFSKSSSSRTGSAPPAPGTTGRATPRPSAWPPGGSPAGPAPRHSESAVCVSGENYIFI